MTHDKLCYVAINGGNCCPWLPECDCQCMCEYIREVRLDTLALAEAAIEAAPRHYWVGWAIEVDVAIAAIDALRGES